MNRTYLRLFGATILWASVFHVGKFALSAYSPLSVAAWRYGFAALILLAISLPEIRRNWTQIREHGFVILILSLTGIVGFGMSIFYGLRLTSPVNAALIMAFNPAMIIVASAVLNHERISPIQVAGLLLGLSGVLIVVTHGSWNALINLSLSKGDLLIGLAAVCWTVYCVLPKRFARDLPSAQLSSTTIIIAALMLLIAAGTMAPDLGQLPSGAMLITMLFLGLFGTVLPYLWWNQGVQKLGPAKAGIFMNLVPIFASLMGVMLGQHLAGSQIAGAAVVIFGVVITSIKFNRRIPAKQNALAPCN